MEPIIMRSAGLDVHKMSVVATIIIEEEDGTVREETRSFGAFKRDRRALCEWLKTEKIELVVMESTGIYWKSCYASLERAGILAYVVNARHVKNVPGRKTDVKDSQWLAALARFGLLKPSFIPPEDLRELRLISRQRIKIQGMLSAEKNRISKVLDDAGIRLSGVVSDINGVSAREIIDGLIEGRPIEELIPLARGRLIKKSPELTECLDEVLGERHRFLLSQIKNHIRFLETELNEMDEYLFAAMKPYQRQFNVLQTIPGIDKLSAAILIIEIGVDMSKFASADKLSSWAGMCPGNNESAGKRKSGRTCKGNQAVRRILCEIAWAATKTKSQFKGKYQSLVIRRGHKRSIVAIGHKLLRIIYSVLKNVKPYHDPEVDYEEIMVQRNAPRWIKALEKFGYLPKTA